MKLSSLKVDAAKIEAGDWVENIPGLPGISLKVRGIGNADYRRRQAQLLRELPRDARVAAEGLDPGTSDKIETVLLVETVLIDWKGLENEDGSPIVFAKEVAAAYLADPNYKPLRMAVAWAANVIAEARALDAKGDQKN